jgi:hypothetical protein
MYVCMDREKGYMRKNSSCSVLVVKEHYVMCLLLASSTLSLLSNLFDDGLGAEQEESDIKNGVKNM